MIGEITKAHYDQILRMNKQFVHWLAPMDRDELIYILNLAKYARQIDNGRGVLIAYDNDTVYPNHENMRWLAKKFDRFFYIDRVIVDGKASGKGYGKMLYVDIENYARSNGYPRLVCEVNTLPDNPGSHSFHEKMGFVPCGQQVVKPGIKAVRYYEKSL